MIAPNVPSSLESIRSSPVGLLGSRGIHGLAREPVEAQQLRGGQADGASIRRAIWPEELLEAHGFLHDALAEQGFIPPSPGGLRITCHDAIPETSVFVAKAATGILAVQCAVTDSEDLGLPSDKAFCLEIGSLRRGGGAICEASRPAVTVPFLKSEIPGELLRCCVAYAVSAGCNQLVVAVQPWEARGYGEMGFGQVGPVRTFSSEIPFPAVLMALRLDEQSVWAARSAQRCPPAGTSLQDHCFHRNPYRQYMERWCALSEQAFADPAFLRGLVRRTDLLIRCTEDERAAIRRRWKTDIFEHIWPAEPSELGARVPAPSSIPLDELPPRILPHGRPGSARGLERARSRRVWKASIPRPERSPTGLPSLGLI